LKNGINVTQMQKDRINTRVKIIFNQLCLIFLSVVLSGMLNGCSEQSAKTVEYSIMSFNIRVSTPQDTLDKSWLKRKDAVAEFINQSQTDVVCLQEVNADQAMNLMGYFSKSEKYEVKYYPRDASSEGLVMLYDKTVFELESDGKFWLSTTPEEQSKSWGSQYIRICTNMLLRHKESGERLNVFNVHLDISQSAPPQQIKVVLDKVKESPYPAVVTGDLNCFFGSNCYNIISAEMQDCQQTALETDSGCTYNGWGTVADNAATPVDYCFASKENVKPLVFEICRDRWNEGSYLSDHYPIRTEIEVTYEK